MTGGASPQPSRRQAGAGRRALAWGVRGVVAWAVGTLVFVALTGLAAAHAGSLGNTSATVDVPAWLFYLTGGGVVAASFLFTSFVTDRRLIRDVHESGPTLGAARALGDDAVGYARLGARAASAVALAVVVTIGFVGPREAVANLAVLVVWAGWWAGYTMTTYLLGNSWPLVNPWRAIADGLRWLARRTGTALDGRADLASTLERWGAWPSVVGLLALVWVEVVSPLADDPRLLSVVVLAYTALTLAGALLVGPTTWFGSVDPVARVFRMYGAIAPIRREPTDAEGADGDGGEDVVAGDGTGRLAFRPPGSVPRDLTSDTSEVAFVVALVWATTYDGLVSTAPWAVLARAVVGAGVPPLALYLAALVVGFALFFAVYRVASQLVRRTARSYADPRYVERRFAPSLLPIAAGYHLAHFLGYALALTPAFAGALAAPLAGPADPQVLVIPGWFGGVQLAFVVLGHLLAVWVAHSIAFEIFTGRLQPIRSQYPYIVVMVFYTMTSMWLLTQPYAAPPFL